MSEEQNIRNNSEWEDLKKLLVGEERELIDKILYRLDTDQIYASEVGKILPEALRIASERGSRLSEVLIPILEQAFRESVKRNPNILAEALYGLIGPAVRKSVSESLKNLMQTFNAALKNVFTFRGIKWRFQSMATGKPYAEIVFLNSVLYKAEQVFLIHKETGLLLNHAKAPDALGQNEDMVSSMLTALQDFARDSFQLEKDESLNSMNVGALTLWIEQSPNAVLAAAIRGEAPESYRRTLQNALERIHKEFGSEIREFEGDVDPFVATEGELSKCLKSKSVEEEDSKPIYARIAVGLIAALLIVLGYFWISSNVKFSKFADRLREEPGIALIETRNGPFRKSAKIFKDPDAASPAGFIDEYDLKPGKVRIDSSDFISLEPELIAAKARKILEIPESIDLNYSDGVLFASGSAPARIVENAVRHAATIPGVRSFDYSKVKITEGETIDSAIEEIEEIKPLFYKNKTSLIPGQEEKINRLFKSLEKLLKFAEGKTVRVEIYGHTDSSGSERTNDKLSWNRAKAVMNMLADRGFEEFDFTLKGLGYKKPLVEEKTEEDMQKNRRVEFRVVIEDAQ